MNTELLKEARLDILVFIDDPSLELSHLESAIALIDKYLVAVEEA